MKRLRADRSAGLLMAAVIVLLFVALLGTVVLPATDPAVAEVDVPALVDICWTCPAG